MRLFITFPPADQTKTHLKYAEDAIGYVVLAEIHMTCIAPGTLLNAL